MARPKSTAPNTSTATIGFEAKLWLTADTALRDSATLRCEANLRSPSEAKDNRSNNMDAAETSGASKTAAGSPQGERGGVHQFGVPPKGNGNFAWVQHFIHHLALDGNTNGRQTLN